MSGDSATETATPRRSWTVWIWRSGLALVFSLPLMYALALMRDREGIRIVEASGGGFVFRSQFQFYDPFHFRNSLGPRYQFLQIDRDAAMVNLSDSRLRGEQLKVLERFPNLFHLRINSDHLGPGLKFLAAKGMPGQLSIVGSPLRTAGVEDFAHLEHLQVFHESGQMDLSGLSRMPKLKELAVNQRMPLTGQDLKPLVDCPQLESLILDAALDTSACQALAKCPQLKSIHITPISSPRSWKGLSGLKDAPLIQELTLNHVTRDTLQELQQVTQLAGLHIDSGRLEAEDLKLLQPLQKLQKITFRTSVQYSPQKLPDGSPDRFDYIEEEEEQIRKLLKELLPKTHITIKGY